MDWHSLLVTLPLLGVTANWRGVRVGGKVLGMSPGFSRNEQTKAFDAAKKAGDRESMEKIARQMNEQRLRGAREKPVEKSNKSGSRISDTDFDKMKPSDRSMSALRAIGLNASSPLDAAEKLSNIGTIMQLGSGMTPKKAAALLSRYPGGQIPPIQVLSKSEFTEIKSMTPGRVSRALDVAKREGFTGSERVRFGKADQFMFSKNSELRGNRAAAESMLIMDKSYSPLKSTDVARFILTGTDKRKSIGGSE